MKLTISYEIRDYLQAKTQTVRETSKIIMYLGCSEHNFNVHYSQNTGYVLLGLRYMVEKIIETVMGAKPKGIQGKFEHNFARRDHK